MSTTRTVLVVDDDEDVLTVTCNYLEALGYTVLPAKNGSDGLRVLEERADIDLLFTDVVMPGGIDGFELAHRAVRKRPNLRVLYTSGFMKDVPFGEQGIRYGRLLTKPWGFQALRDALDRTFPAS